MQCTNPNNSNHLLPDMKPTFFRRRAGGLESDDAGSFAHTYISRSRSSLNLSHLPFSKESKNKGQKIGGETGED